MAIVTILSCGSTAGHKSLKNVLNYCTKEAKTLKDGHRLVSGINCIPSSAYSSMMATKKFYRKTGGREYYHLCQSFSPEEGITPEQAHDIAYEFAWEQFKGYEVIVATHVDAEHIHSHIVLNSVSFEDGKKYHSDKNNIPRLREASDEICRKHGLAIIKTQGPKKVKPIGTREYRSAKSQNSWKINLAVMIETAMKKAKTKEEFMEFMKDHGYQVTWTDSRKYITYTTPEGNKCRDNKLHEEKFLKEVMQNEFRIRQQIIRSQTVGKGKPQYSSEGNTMCNGNGSKLEGPSVGGKVVNGNIRAYGYKRRDAELSQPAQQDLHNGDGMVAAETGIYIKGYGGEVEANAGDVGVTGWETERAICFGDGEIEEAIGKGYADSYRETISPIPASVPAVDLLVSSSYLAADIASLIEPSSHPGEENWRDWEAQEKRERLKKEGQGPIMKM